MPADHTASHGPATGGGRHRRRRHLVAAVIGFMTLLPGLVLVAPGVAAAAYPDNPAQPVNFGTAGFYGPSGGLQLNAPAVGMASTASGNGYWIVASDGGIFNYGDAGFFGSAGALPLNKPIVGMAATKDGGGYWLVASDGGVFNYGDAGFFGSAGSLPLNAPIVGMAATPDGGGYWLVASDGGIFSYGDATFYGSAGSIHLNQPVVGMAASPGGTGYWLVASDGGIFNYGTAPFLGSTGGTPLNAPIVGMAAGPGGYWLAAVDGGIFNFGTAFLGSMGGQSNSNPIRAIAARPDGGGYWLLPTSPPPAPPTLSPGADGAAVASLQTQLLALGYWVDTTGGTFDDSTEQAVWALQKAANLTRDGVVGPATWAALNAGVVPQPRPASGYEIQIDLEDDLLMVVNNGHLVWTLNTSTGGGYTYTQDGVVNIATTPTGVFQTNRVVDGTVTDSLGTLWRPRFFYEGYAIHGDSSVPPYPVSHGCARISNEAIDWVWANNIDPIGTTVWVY
ncbi:MAG: L,D-transpeptidase family protein [Acidimicrobiales bacterium]|jgi:peptidoglycan hydrolase-like protein with peptidoglycan-binding domain